MTTFPGAPRLIKGGIVLLDAETGALQRVISLQYNPDTLTRTLQPNIAGADGQTRMLPHRTIGPPQETYQMEAFIDAADQLASPQENPTVLEFGIYPQLAALESIVYPESGQVVTSHRLAASGVLEVVPPAAPLILFVWSKNRVLPIQLTEFSITEEAFDPQLNPLRARISLSMRVLNTNDLSLAHRGGTIFLGHHQKLEQLALKSREAFIVDLGLKEL